MQYHRIRWKIAERRTILIGNVQPQIRNPLAGSGQCNQVEELIDLVRYDTTWVALA
jgi:hypothetical protein